MGLSIPRAQAAAGLAIGNVTLLRGSLCAKEVQVNGSWFPAWVAYTMTRMCMSMTSALSLGYHKGEGEEVVNMLCIVRA